MAWGISDWRSIRDARRSAVSREKERQEKMISEGKFLSALGHKGIFSEGGLPQPSFWKGDGARVWVFA